MARMLGRIMVEQEVITEEQLLNVLSEMNESRIGSKRRIGEVMVDMGVATQAEVNSALDVQRDESS